MKIAASIFTWLTIILTIFTLVMTIFCVVTKLNQHENIVISSYIITFIISLVTFLIGINSGISVIEALLFKY